MLHALDLDEELLLNGSRVAEVGLKFRFLQFLSLEYDFDILTLVDGALHGLHQVQFRLIAFDLN